MLSLLSWTLLAWLIHPPAATPGADSPTFSYEGEIAGIYQKIMDLRLEEAQTLLLDLGDQDPNNLARIHLQNYVDLLRVFISEEETLYREWRHEIPGRLRTVRRGDPDCPYTLYVQAEIRLHWALARLKFGEYLGAFNQVSIAYQLLRQNQKRFPEFIPNRKDLGLLHALVGSIPDGYRWAFKLISGMGGSLTEGMAQLNAAARQGGVFQQEAVALLAYGRLYLEDQPENAWTLVTSDIFHPQQSSLHCFLLTNVAMRTFRNDEALALLAERPVGKAYFPFPFLDFLEGLARLRKLDLSAEQSFARFLSNNRGRHFIKEALQKRAWIALLRGDKAGYRDWMEKCLEKGQREVGEDEAAWREAQSALPPHPDLLCARLLFDGGYFRAAEAKIAELKVEALQHQKWKVEYHYRSGRINQQVGQATAALEAFDLSLELGKGQPWYFPARAALESGRICESKGWKQRAYHYYRTCLSLSPEAYRKGLHQRARAGLARLKSD